MKKRILREWEVLQAAEAHEQEIQSTPVGRTSSDLRKRGMSLKEQGRTEEALELLRQAVTLHPSTDEGPAAGAARYALGCLLAEDPRAYLQTLDSAEQMLRCALKAPSLSRVPRYHAQTEKALAMCLRRKASNWHGACPPVLLEEIESLYRTALWRLEKRNGARM